MDSNRVTLIGRVARPPESQGLPSGKTITTFRVATSTRYEMKGGQIVDTVEFHDVTAGGKLGEIVAQYVKADSRVYVEGRLRSRSEKGRRGRQVHVEADNLIMLGHRQAGAA